MINNLLALAALRARLKSLVVATTGSTALASTATGYTRLTGSFIDEGFERGMEVVPSGFPSNAPGIVSVVNDLSMTIEGGRSASASSAGRSLTVGLPSHRAWENMPFTPEDRRWFIEEDYIPGPAFSVTIGSTHEVQVEPMYVLRLYGLSGIGITAIYLVADAILRLYAPGTALPMSDGQVLRVKGDPAPNRGQVVAEGASHALTVITVPLWARTFNNGV